MQPMQMDRRSSLPPSKRSSLDLEPANPARGLGAVPLLPLGSRAPSSSRPIPPLDLASRVPAGTSPAGGGPGGLRSSRSNRSITWAGEDGQGGEVGCVCDLCGVCLSGTQIGPNPS